jgi:hypothetical protein
MKASEIKIGTTVWGPKRSYLGDVTSIHNDVFGNTFAEVTWGENIGLRCKAICNIKKVEVFEE